MTSASYYVPTDNWYSAFSLRRVYIAGGAGRLEPGNSASVNKWFRVPGSINLTVTPNAKTVDQYGDDGLVNIWNYDARATLEFETSMTGPTILSIITGNTVTANTTLGGSPTTIYMGSDLEHTPPHFFIRAYAAARFEGPGTPTSASEYVRYTFFNCQMSNVQLPESVRYGSVHQNIYRVEVLPGYVDENGASLANVGGPGSTFALCRAEFGLQAFPKELPNNPDVNYATLYG